LLLVQILSRAQNDTHHFLLSSFIFSLSSSMPTLLITWTSKGIGKHLASSLQTKASIIGISRSDNTLTGIKHIVWDLRENTFLESLPEKLPEIDFLILNAGVWAFWKFDEISPETHKDVLETNLLSPIRLTSLLFPKIRKGIIAIGSVASKKSWKFATSYQASKFGLRGFMMGLKNEYPKLSIHLINPSIVETDFHASAPFPIVWKYPLTPLSEILSTVENILSGSEKRFEIDL